MSHFTFDWFSHNIASWTPILTPFRGRPANVLEIGSYEGRSATFFLEFLPSCQVTCVDPFCAQREWMGDYEARFDTNMAPFGRRVRKIKSRSVGTLDDLAHAGERFDIIYIDGDHSRRGAFCDSVLAWPLLKTGGVLIWDDYIWKRGELPPDARPEYAVDLFVAVFAPCLEKLNCGYQMIVKKTAEWPPTPVVVPESLRALERRLDELQTDVKEVKKELSGRLTRSGLARWLLRRVTPSKRLKAAVARLFRPHA
jgi:hypothetical protein